MLNKTFKDKTLSTGIAAPAGVAPNEEVMLRFQDTLRALLGALDEKRANALIERVVGTPPATLTDMKRAWYEQRLALLHTKQDSLLAFGEVMAMIRAHAVATYLNDEFKHEDIYGVSGKTKMDAALHGVLESGAETLDELKKHLARSPHHAGDEQIGSYERRLAHNARMSDNPYLGEKTGEAYNRLMAHFDLNQSAAMAATIRLAELDLAYAARGARIGVHESNNSTRHVMDMRNMQYAHTVKQYNQPAGEPVKARLSPAQLRDRTRATGIVYH